MLTAEQVAKLLKLEPLEEEGGMFRNTYLTGESWDDKHSLGSAIYFLLSKKAYSHLHRLPSDEVYHFYMGSPVELYQITPGGEVIATILGTDLLAGQLPQAVVPAGNWQGSRLVPGGEWALLGTTMCPGFAPEDYEHAANIEALKKQFPKAVEVIDKITGDTVFM